MATFPALKPATRNYTLGEYPVTEEKGFGGGSIRFKHGIYSAPHTLNLTFSPLTPAQAKLIRDHYRTQQGGFFSFSLSPEIWAGHATSSFLQAPLIQWRYASAPQETHDARGFIEVSLTLESVRAFTSGNAFGMAKTLTATLSRGTGGV